jgi:transcriptional regulator with XRE-family HTH domain
MEWQEGTVTLEEFLTERGETQAEFGQRAQVRQQVVSRWAQGFAIPRPAFMAAIGRLTQGKVQPADFYHAHDARRAALAAAEQAAEAAAAASMQAGQDAAAAELAAEAAWRETEEEVYRQQLQELRAGLRAA